MKASKCQLIVKDQKIGEAEKCFENTGITVKVGAPVLGSVIGTESVKSLPEIEQNEQIKILKKLAKVAKPPHPPKTFMPAILKEFNKNVHFLLRQRLTLWKT